MSLNTISAETAWGSVHAYLGDVGASGVMGAVLEDLGSIDEDALTIETNDGTKYQLKDINGKLLDELMQEPELKVNFTLLKPSEVVKDKFWSISEIGTGDARKIRVKSLIKNKKYSFKFANTEAVGSETFEAPVTKVYMKPSYDAKKGFSAQCTITLLKGEADYLFDFGVVAALDALAVTPTTLSFTAAADTIGKTITATSSGNISASNNGSYWLQLTYALKVATIKVPANPNTEARTGVITITADGKTANVVVTQAGA